MFGDNAQKIGKVRILLVIYLIFMTVALLIPTEWLPIWLRGGESLFPGFGAKDKLLHGCSFAVLALLGIRSLRGVSYWSRAITILAVCFLYGLTTEILQGLTGFRDYELLDLGADMVGAFVGVMIARLFDRRQALFLA